MVVEKAIGEYTDFRIPGIVVTEKGTLLRYCECRKNQHDWAAIDIKISRSADEGLTWNTALILMGDGNTLNNPVMFVCGDKLVFLYCKNYKEIWKCVSFDDGVTFTEPQKVDFESKVDFFYNCVAVGPGHGICHQGKLIVPAWFAYNREEPKSHHPSFTSTLYSEDGGDTWQVGEKIFSDDLVDPSESAVAVTSDGEILISIRHGGAERTRALAKSADGISGWYDLRFEENLADPVCMGGMTHGNGKIYHINCDSASERKNITVKISDDCFKTFHRVDVSEIGGYSDIAYKDNKLYLLYETSVRIGSGGWEPFRLNFDVINLDLI